MLLTTASTFIFFLRLMYSILGTTKKVFGRRQVYLHLSAILTALIEIYKFNANTSETI